MRTTYQEAVQIAHSIPRHTFAAMARSPSEAKIVKPKARDDWNGYMRRLRDARRTVPKRRWTPRPELAGLNRKAYKAAWMRDSRNHFKSGVKNLALCLAVLGANLNV